MSGRQRILEPYMFKQGEIMQDAFVGPTLPTILLIPASNRHAPACGARYIRKNQMSCNKEIHFLRVLILRRYYEGLKA